MWALAILAQKIYQALEINAQHYWLTSIPLSVAVQIGNRCLYVDYRLLINDVFVC